MTTKTKAKTELIRRVTIVVLVQLYACLEEKFKPQKIRVIRGYYLELKALKNNG